MWDPERFQTSTVTIIWFLVRLTGSQSVFVTVDVWGLLSLAAVKNMWIYVSGSRDYKILSSESRVWENQSRIASPVHNEQSSSTGRVSAVLNVAVGGCCVQRRCVTSVAACTSLRPRGGAIPAARRRLRHTAVRPAEWRHSLTTGLIDTARRVCSRVCVIVRRPSVCSICRPLQQRPAGLLLGNPTGKRYRLFHHLAAARRCSVLLLWARPERPAAAAHSGTVVLQQMRAVSRC